MADTDLVVIVGGPAAVASDFPRTIDSAMLHPGAPVLLVDATAPILGARVGFSVCGGA